MYPSQQNATDQTANFFWILAMIIGAALLVWWLYRPLIVTPIFLVRDYEIKLINLFAISITEVLRWFHLPTPHVNYLQAIQKYMQQANPRKVSFDVFAHINTYLGRWVRWPVVIILLILAALIRFKHKGARFKKHYDMEALKKTEAENWPQIVPVLSLDLVKSDIEKGVWAMAKMPLDFCKENKLVFITTINDKQVWGLHRSPAQRLFALQLGQLWRGPRALPIHLRALAAVFLGRAYRDREQGNRLLAQIAASAASGRLDFTGVDELLAKFENHELVKWLSKRHSYVATYMMSLLEGARRDGVLASSEFLWLKPLDRRMWYVLNSVGRQTAVVEIAGIFAHWMAEKKLGRAMKTPMVKEAVNALEIDMNKTLYIDESGVWRRTNAA